MMHAVDNLANTLAQFGVHTNKPFYISAKSKLDSIPSHFFLTDYYCINLCIEGTLQLCIDDQLFKLEQNHLYISAPTTIVKLIERSEDYNMRVLFFEKEFMMKNIIDPFYLDRLNVFNGENFKLLELDNKQVEEISHIFNLLMEKNKETSLFKNDFIRTLLNYLLLNIADVNYYASKKNNPHQDSNFLYHKFVNLIHTHIYKHKSVKFYAKEMCVSEKHLILLVKNASGKTPHQIIDEALLKFALVILNNPSLSIAEIAYKLDFSSSASFARFFKRQKGISPQLYRKSNDSLNNV